MKFAILIVNFANFSVTWIVQPLGPTSAVFDFKMR